MSAILKYAVVVSALLMLSGAAQANWSKGAEKVGDEWNPVKIVFIKAAKCDAAANELDCVKTVKGVSTGEIEKHSKLPDKRCMYCMSGESVGKCEDFAAGRYDCAPPMIEEPNAAVGGGGDVKVPASWLEDLTELVQCVLTKSLSDCATEKDQYIDEAARATATVTVMPDAKKKIAEWDAIVNNVGDWKAVQPNSKIADAFIDDVQNQVEKDLDLFTAPGTGHVAAVVSGNGGSSVGAPIVTTNVPTPVTTNVTTNVPTPNPNASTSGAVPTSTPTPSDVSVNPPNVELESIDSDDEEY